LIALDAGVTILGDKLMLANGMDLKHDHSALSVDEFAKAA
jgi:hypothetical protein